MANFRDLTENRDLKLGTYIGEFATPGIGRILKAAGCEFAFVDMEHSGFSFETAKAVLRNLHDVGVATLLRPPSHAYHHLARACDVGAQGVIPPMLETAEQAQACIDSIYYPPLGKRGCAFGIAHDDYENASVLEAMYAANKKIVFSGLLETAKGVENCEEIAALDGVDCLWIGHFDLSASLGVPGQFENPLFTEAVDTILAAAQKNELSVGRLVASSEEGAKLHREGCDLICYSGDIWLLGQGLASGFASVRSALEN